MATDSQGKPSFSLRRKWGSAIHVSILCALVFSVVVMANYLSRDFFRRFQWSTNSKHQLSPLSLRLVRSITNQVEVTVYYDADDPVYDTITALLQEYHLANDAISIKVVDYLRDPGASQTIRSRYKLSSRSEKNMIIFECGSKWLLVDGDSLIRYVFEQLPTTEKIEFRRKPVEFEGERRFTSALLAVTNPGKLKAYALQGHGEHSFDSGDESAGYLEFTGLLEQYGVNVQPLSLLGTKTVPMDCNLLILAGPRKALDETEVDQIDEYLSQGGRMLAMFNAAGLARDNGLERVLAKWGVRIGHSIISDPDNHSKYQLDVIVKNFTNHIIVNPLIGADMWLDLIRPRPVGKLPARGQSADAPQVTEIAFTGPSATCADSSRAGSFPVVVAVEKGAIKDVLTERGTTRLVVIGDSTFLANTPINSLANRDFAGLAVNWLLDRSRLLGDVGPQALSPYRLVMTRRQLQQAQWILVGGLPGLILIIGGMVWLRRRK